MPRRKAATLAKKRDSLQDILNQLTWGESYTSLLLGVLVVIIFAVLSISFLRNREAEKAPRQEVSSTSTQKNEKEEANPAPQASTYSVVAGDTLWSIAEKQYKSGYNWVDIAAVNKLEDPGVIELGQKLELPKVEPRVVIAPVDQTAQAPPQKITTNSYTVVKDDTLWDIAVRAYGDGFKWVEIARSNNIANPDLIFPDNTFTLPR